MSLSILTHGPLLSLFDRKNLMKLQNDVELQIFYFTHHRSPKY